MSSLKYLAVLTVLSAFTAPAAASGYVNSGIGLALEKRAASGYANSGIELALEKRDTTGPINECHANCGYTIQMSQQSPTFCNSTTWQKYYSACLECANTYNLWPDYGSGVTTAAAKCGLTAVPLSGNSTTNATTTSSSASGTASATSTGATASKTASGDASNVHTTGLMLMAASFLTVYIGYI